MSARTDAAVAAGVPPALVAELTAHFGAERVRVQCERLVRDRHAIDDPALWLHTALHGDFKDMPLERLTRCTCGAETLEPLSRFVFWNLQGVAGCRACGAVFASPRLTDDAVRRIFAEHYFAGEPPAYWGERRAPVFAQVARELRARGVQRVLDVGAAYGHLLAYLRDAGLAGSGCDLSAPAVAWGRRALELDLHEGTVDALPSDRTGFDAVVSLDTLYYAADPMHDLRAMAGRLRPGGVLLLRLRRGDGAWARARAAGRAPIGPTVMPSEHRWALSAATMKTLLAQAGFTGVRITPGAHSRAPGSTLLDLAAAANVAVRRVLPAVPVFTQSYLAIATKATP